MSVFTTNCELLMRTIFKKDNGIAIRFPRFIRFRDDKGPEDATTTSEIVTYYKSQRLQK